MSFRSMFLLRDVNFSHRAVCKEYRVWLASCLAMPVCIISLRSVPVSTYVPIKNRYNRATGVQTFLHVGESFLQLVIHLWTKGKVIHKNNTAREQIQSVDYTLCNIVAFIDFIQKLHFIKGSQEEKKEKKNPNVDNLEKWR